MKKFALTHLAQLALLALLALLTTAPLLSQTQAIPASSNLPLDPRLGITPIALWPAGTPQAADTSLTVFVPQRGKGNGSAILIAPGGGYQMLAMNLEGTQVAAWFTTRGFTAFVLQYRIGLQHLYPQPLDDAQHALRLIRSMASDYKINPARVGMIGFSAGGHLSAAASTLFHAADPNSADPLARFSDRPDFVVLGYPWMNAMMAPIGKKINYCGNMKLPDTSCKAYDLAYSPVLHVSANTSPTFLYSTTDDPIVPIAPTVDYYKALLAAGVPVEMHLFRHGPHGTGFGTGDAALDMWPVLLEQWLRDQGLITKDPSLVQAPKPNTPSK